MKRVWRWTAGVTTALSPLLCLATLLAWYATVRGGYYARARAAPADRRIWSVGIDSDGLSVTSISPCPHPPLSGAYVTRHQRMPLTWRPVQIDWNTTPPEWSLIGTMWWSQRSGVQLLPPGGLWTEARVDLGEDIGNWSVAFRYGLVAAGSSLLPLWLVASRGIARWRRAPPGCCPSCRYDLTANESGVCPECGTKL